MKPELDETMLQPLLDQAQGLATHFTQQAKEGVILPLCKESLCQLVVSALMEDLEPEIQMVCDRALNEGW